MWASIWNWICYLYNFTIVGYISFPIDPLLYDWKGNLPIYILFIIFIVTLWFWATQKGRSIRIGKIEWTFKTNMWDFWTMSNGRWNIYKKYGFIRRKEYKNYSFYIKKKAPQGLLQRAEIL